VFHDNLFDHDKPLFHVFVQVAVALIKIFQDFECPSIIHTDNGSEFVNEIVEALDILWPDLLFVHGKPRRPWVQGSVERLNQTIGVLACIWLSERATTDWTAEFALGR